MGLFHQAGGAQRILDDLADARWSDSLLGLNPAAV
jgi:hypothetical protein